MGKQNSKLIENIKRYEEKKTKQSKSKVYGQKSVKRETNKEKSICLYHSQWCESVYCMV